MKGRKPQYNTDQDMMVPQNPVLVYMARQMAVASYRDIKDLYTDAFMNQFSITSQDIMNARQEMLGFRKPGSWIKKSIKEKEDKNESSNK